MYTIPPFVPKIYVEYPDKIYYYASLEEYKKDHPFNAYFYHRRNEQYTNGNPYYICRHCDLKHPKASNFPNKCFVETYVPNYEKARILKVSPFSSGMFEIKQVENKKGHTLIPVVRLRNELGDNIDSSYTHSKKQRLIDRQDTQYNWWINGSSSPNNRGLLESEISKRDNDYYHKFRHYLAARDRPNYYRRLRTQNERKQYESSLIDENSPRIRAKRSLASLPNSWDDHYPCHQRTWKNKKITRQYMVNV